MTEFVAPYSKQHLFMVLHKYNADPEPILATAQVIKDSSFFPASQNTYVAAVSFRVSMFGNPKSGWVYQYIPPDYVIAADLDTTHHSEDYINSHVLTPVYDFSGEDEKQGTYITLVPGESEGYGDGAVHTGIGSTDISALLEGSAGSINRYMMTDGTVIKVPHTKDDISDDYKHWEKYALVSLTENPSLSLDSVGFGRQGLGVMKGKITFSQGPYDSGDGWNNISPRYDGNRAQQINRGSDSESREVIDIQRIQFRLEVMKNSLPSTWTVFDFGKYLSSGVHLYNQEIYRGCLIDVIGPALLQSLRDDVDGTDLTWQDHTYDDTGHQRLLPTVRITSQNGELFSTGMVNYTTRDEETGKYKGKPKKAYMQLGRECFRDSGGKFIAYLSGRISKHYDEYGDEVPLAGARWSDDHPDTDDIQPYQKFGLFEDDNEDWFVYNSTGPVMENFRFNKVPVKTIQAYQQNYNEDNTEQGAPVEIQFDPDWTRDDWDLTGGVQRIQFLSATTQRHRMQGRTHKTSDVGVFTVNELFEIFNAPDLNDGYWQLQVASNGGFEIRILKNVGRFHITKEFADQLGLSDELTCVESARPDDPEYHRQIVDSQVQVNYIFLRVNMKSSPHEAESLEVAEMDYDELVKEDTLDGYFFVVEQEGSHEIKQSQSWLGVVQGKEVYHESNPSIVYRLIGRKERTFVNTKGYMRTLKANVRMVDGIQMYEWEDPPFPSVIRNTARVSVESFSLFEGIQITLPDLPFMPQITSWSNGERTLLELRLPVPYGTGNDAQGRVAGTSFPYIADLIWNVGGSGFEWSPVSSIGDLYQVTANCSLVYRDANNRPPRPLYIPQGGLFQLKVCFLEVK